MRGLAEAVRVTEEAVRMLLEAVRVIIKAIRKIIQGADDKLGQTLQTHLKL